MYHIIRVIRAIRVTRVIREREGERVQVCIPPSEGSRRTPPNDDTKRREGCYVLNNKIIRVIRIIRAIKDKRAIGWGFYDFCFTR